jgi:hypothetical protein
MLTVGVGLPLLALSREEVLGRHAPGAMSVAAWSSLPVQLSLVYWVKLFGWVGGEGAGSG